MLSPAIPHDDDRPVSSGVLDQAIAWQLRLDADDPDDARYPQFQQWLAARPEHARAWRQLNALDAALQPAHGRAVRSALLAPRTARRKPAALLGLLLGTCVLALMAADRLQPLDAWMADHHTATGERARIVLADQTVVHLNTRTALDVAFDEQQRAVILRRGEVAIQTGPKDARPFVVITPDGSTLHALGTRFVVRTLERGLRLSVIESAVEVRPPRCAPLPADCAAAQVIAAGESLLFDGDAPGTRAPAAAGADAWKDGMLVVENAPLADVVSELARYRRGMLTLAPEAAGLRVTGAVPLADTDAALLALAASHPLQLRSFGSLWARLERAPEE